MDDFLSSFHNILVAIKGRFPIDQIYFKQLLNTSSFTNNVSPKLTEINLSVNNTPINPALGIMWNSKTDIFHIKYKLKSVLATKWGILSLISSIFDPLGLTTPALIEPKWILQLYKRKIDWDELAKIARQSTWHIKYHFRRMVPITDTGIELHVFADTSKIAYGLTCYIKFEGCVCYIFASLFCMFKTDHFWNKEKCFLFHFESSFCSWDNQILFFQIFKCHDVIKRLSMKHKRHFIE